MEQLSNKGIETFRLDVTKPEEIQEVKSKVSELTGGSLDILVNSAYVPHIDLPSHHLTHILAPVVSVGPHILSAALDVTHRLHSLPNALHGHHHDPHPRRDGRQLLRSSRNDARIHPSSPQLIRPTRPAPRERFRVLPRSFLLYLQLQQSRARSSRKLTQGGAETIGD